MYPLKYQKTGVGLHWGSFLILCLQKEYYNQIGRELEYLFIELEKLLDCHMKDMWTIICSSRKNIIII